MLDDRNGRPARPPSALYSATRGQRLGHDAVVLCGPDGLRAEISRHGATLLRLARNVRGQPWDFAWGYDSKSGLETHADSRFALMVPFAGRIRESAYTFGGQTRELESHPADPGHVAMHGLARDVDFHIAALHASPHLASTLLTATIGPVAGYPFRIAVDVLFELAGTGLQVAATMRNVGDTDAPCFFGWHAYVRPAAGKVDDWVLHVPARQRIAMGQDLIAVDGPAAYTPVGARRELDFSAPRKIGGTVIDNAYGDLVPRSDGRIRCTACDPVSGTSVAVWQYGGIVRVFTGDTLAHGAREAIAIEPMEAIANAFNRADCRERVTLAPGASKVFRCGIDLDVAPRGDHA
ncbi:MAG TPA: aldose epimerase [Rhodanobacteraceae bacterium]